MNQAFQVLNKIWKTGLEIWTDSPDRLLVTPKPLITDDLRSEIKNNKPGILEILHDCHNLAEKQMIEAMTPEEQRWYQLGLLQRGIRIIYSPRKCHVLVHPYSSYSEPYVTARLQAILKRAFAAPLAVSTERLQDQLPPPRLKGNNPGFVYVLYSDDGYCKIGRAKSLDKRISRIKLQMPFRVKLIHSIRVSDCVWAEKHLHQKFRRQRMNGEWFKLSADDIAWIKSLTSLEP